MEQEKFERHQKTAELMRKINEEIEKMDAAEFTIYVNAVEIPHTLQLQAKKQQYEKEGAN